MIKYFNQLYYSRQYVIIILLARNDGSTYAMKK
jgi:hypothetical protein